LLLSKRFQLRRTTNESMNVLPSRLRGQLYIDQTRKFSMTSAVAFMGCHVIAKHDLIRQYALMQQAAAPEVPGTMYYISGSLRATGSSVAWTPTAGADTEYCIIQRGRMIDSLDGWIWRRRTRGRSNGDCGRSKANAVRGSSRACGGGRSANIARVKRAV